MRDLERISRLLGAALKECSESKMEEVRRHVARAIGALDSESRKKTRTIKRKQLEEIKNKSMTKQQGTVALDAIQNMIEKEASKLKDDGSEVETIFG